jgi:hypothetical protein
MKTVSLGSLLGLTWSASLRGWMVDVAGDESAFTWTGTFLCLLLPGALVGGLLAEPSTCNGRAGSPGGSRLRRSSSASVPSRSPERSDT